MANLFIGTSGFSYSHWEGGVFYPDDLPKKKQLEFFSDYFGTVEINNSFYQLPKNQTFINWRKRTPKDFVFAIKISRFITHIKRLNDCERAWKTFLKRAVNLGPKLGPFLFQLPPNWKSDKERLENFIKIIEKNNSNLKFAFEFRHPSWFSSDTYSLFKYYKNLAFSINDSPSWPSVGKVIGGFVYIRMHGKKRLYSSNYSKKELEELGVKIKKYLKRGLDVYCYFNNDANGFAVKNAKQLISICKE